MVPPLTTFPQSPSFAPSPADLVRSAAESCPSIFSSHPIVLAATKPLSTSRRFLSLLPCRQVLGVGSCSASSNPCYLQYHQDLSQCPRIRDIRHRRHQSTF